VTGHDIVVIGASAGGVEALPQLTAQLSPDFCGSLFVVQHISATVESSLPAIINRKSALKAVHPKDKQKISRGRIYLAPSDHHLWLEDSRIRVTKGPRINRHRPAIDPLFESAAHVYKQRVVGVVLTGSLDDGAAGLHMIKRCGGVAVVQDPNDALVASMPENALLKVDPDHVLPLASIGALLAELSQKPFKKKKINCPKIKFFMDSQLVRPDEMQRENGPPSGFVCPECNGPLWELRDGHIVKYRCLTGHSYSPESLLDEEREELERALWTATKILQERATLLKKLSSDEWGRNRFRTAKSFDDRVEDLEAQAQTIRNIANKIEAVT
jgi:two-component system chemotaxis response regulator CheB